MTRSISLTYVIAALSMMFFTHESFGNHSKTPVDAQQVRQLAAAYLLGLDSTIEDQLDGTFDTLSGPIVVGEHLAVFAYDGTGDCAMKVVIDPKSFQVNPRFSSRSWDCYY